MPGLGVLLCVLVAIALLIRGVGTRPVDARRAFTPDYWSSDLAIDSSTGQLWIRHGVNERVLGKHDIRGYRHESVLVGEVGHDAGLEHRFVFTLREPAHANVVVTFDSGRDVELWKQRLNDFFRG